MIKDINDPMWDNVLSVRMQSARENKGAGVIPKKEKDKRRIQKRKGHSFWLDSNQNTY